MWNKEKKSDRRANGQKTNEPDEIAGKPMKDLKKLQRSVVPVPMIRDLQFERWGSFTFVRNRLPLTVTA